MEKATRAQQVQDSSRAEQNCRPDVYGSKTIALDSSSKGPTVCPPTQSSSSDSARVQNTRTRGQSQFA